MATVLVTGGAGFVGSHLVDRLLADRHRVRVLDSLEPQVHGATGRMPAYLDGGAEFLRGDIRNPADVRRALDGVEIVFHQAAIVGVGQSMYDVRRYVDINGVGGATLLEGIIARKDALKKVIVASSMSAYGEGAYRCRDCGPARPGLRTAGQLARSEWELACPTCGQPLQAIPTVETQPLEPASIYAITKRDHEEMFLSIGRAYHVPTVALRYFNIFGPRQALSNPYTGVLAIFSARMLHGDAPIIFEDGLQCRDFVHVDDIVQANVLAMQSDAANYEVFNVGTGRPITVAQVARTLADQLEFRGDIVAGGKFRFGDIRHCYPDVSKIHDMLGYEAKVTFQEGVRQLAGWVREQAMPEVA